MTSFLKSLLVTSLIATAGFATYAQTTATTAATTSAQTTADSAKAGERGARGDHMGMMAKRVDALKAKLKITAAQEGAWTTFTTAMQPPARMDHQRPDRAEMEKLTTPERIDKMREMRKQRMTDMEAAMDKRDDATKTFYAALAPEQQKVFDAEHARMGKHHGGKHGMHWGGGSDKPTK